MWCDCCADRERRCMLNNIPVITARRTSRCKPAVNEKNVTSGTISFFPPYLCFISLSLTFTSLSLSLSLFKFSLPSLLPRRHWRRCAMTRHTNDLAAMQQKNCCTPIICKHFWKRSPARMGASLFPADQKLCRLLRFQQAPLATQPWATAHH